MEDKLMVQFLALNTLAPHPNNPRLSPREEVVEQIAAQLHGSMDEAYALIVRPFEGKKYQIVSGHHRLLAAKKAGLKEVPCWVREMTDTEAYMALVLSNAQSELHPLEIGLHALRSGKKIRDYAKETGIAERTLHDRVSAAKVADVVHMHNELIDSWRNLAEIRHAPEWLWKALVTELQHQRWTVEATRQAVKSVAETPEPPVWTDHEKIAIALIAGTMRTADIAKFQTTRDKTEGRLADEGIREAFTIAVEKSSFAALSELTALCQAHENKQADLDRMAREEEVKKQREQEAQTAQLARYRKAISLDEWHSLNKDAQQELLAFTSKTAPSFNKQESQDIEWAQYSWNPITGCLHDCPYCYARDIANSERMKDIYPNRFMPTLRPLMLLAPKNQKPPKEATNDTRFRNVFTGSMADIFGRWVPQEWIEAVLTQVRTSPEWNFLFLTKFPGRMAEFTYSQNAWLGTTVDLQVRVAAAEKAFAKVNAPVRWLSIEPMLEPLRFKRLDLFHWVVIGGASSSSKTPSWKPPFIWIYDLVQQAREAGTKIYFKSNLLGSPVRILELPFDAPITKDEASLPEAFRYLPSQEEKAA